MYAAPPMMIEVVAFACRGTLVDWTGAIEAVAYEVARRNGESPLDRGARLRRRVEALAGGDGLARGFERLARERRYRVGRDGDELLTTVVAMARPLPGAREAVALALGSGRRVLAVSRGDSPRALDLFDDAFEDVAAHPAEIDGDPDAILYVSRAPWRRAEARSAGLRAVAPGALGRALATHPAPATRLGAMSGLAVQPISTGEAVVTSLRARILDGVIAPGARLPEAELAADFGVARPTVREAIQTLCHEGLLVRERNRSAHIPVLTSEEILDLFSVRIPLECLIVRAVLERKAPLAPAREAMAVMEALPNDAGWSKVVSADAAFHQALVSAVGSPRLERLYGALSGEIRLCVAQLRPSWASPSAIGHEHHEVIDVLESGDVEAAEARMTAHLERAVRDLTH